MYQKKQVIRESNILLALIKKDFGIIGGGRWYRSNVHSSLVLDYDNSVFYFNSRNIVGNVVDYLVKIRGLSLHTAKNYLDKLDYIPIDKIENKVKSSIIEPTYVKLMTSMFLTGKDNRDYWYKRLLTDETIDKYQLGFYEGFYTLPIINNEELENIQMRRDIPDKRIFSWYKRPISIFNRDILQIVDIVYLVEGIVDCILLNQKGLVSVSKNTGAGGWLDEWTKYFIKQQIIYLVFDNDIAGQRGAKAIAKKLGEYKCKIFTFDGFDKPGYDIIDFFRDGNTTKEFKELVKNESKYLFEISHS